MTVLKQSNEVTKIAFVCVHVLKKFHIKTVLTIYQTKTSGFSPFETIKQKDNHGPTHTLLSGLILIIHIHYIYMRLCGIRLLFCGFLLQSLSSTMFHSARACVHIYGTNPTHLKRCKNGKWFNSAGNLSVWTDRRQQRKRMRGKERPKNDTRLCASVCVGRVEQGAQLGPKQCEGVENSRVCVLTACQRGSSSEWCRHGPVLFINLYFTHTHRHTCTQARTTERQAQWPAEEVSALLPSDQAEPYRRSLRTTRFALTGSEGNKSQQIGGMEEAPERQQDDTFDRRISESGAFWMINRRQMDML